MKTLPIFEKFVSLQGEGPTQGIPTSFIRVVGCNLECFYCDTKYALSTFAIPEESIKTIVEWTKAQWPSHVCITGGEPLLYINTIDLIRDLVYSEHNIIVETNGTIDLKAVKRKLPQGALSIGQISFVMDFKTPKVINTEDQTTTMIKNLREISEYDSVKFVILLDEVGWALETIKKFDIKNVIISPIITLPKDGTWTFPDPALPEYVKQFMEGTIPNVKFQIQIHKLIYGDQRGV